uniref:Uncharacterized protein n=1 Tax=Hyaloperonospora arabidopsidis (strain Emoy2) TaxID=559515 RepID=M4C1I6_HYAAE
MVLSCCRLIAAAMNFLQAWPHRLVGAHHVGPETCLDWSRACLPQCRRRSTQWRLQVSMWAFC